MEKIKRNRASTIKRMVNALEEVLAEHGIEGVSINLITQKASISKVLLYRYFGNLPGLIEYYVRIGRLVPHYSPDWVAQIQPAHPENLASIWSGNALQVFRQLRASRSSREILKATVQENSALSDSVSMTLDGELTQLVNQLSFVKGSDHEAVSAVMLGALSYLTLQSHYDRPVIGLDLRRDENWLRIEKAVKLIYQALAQTAIDSSTVQVDLKSVDEMASAW
ncbi:TetR/AcrR family transcriptional regulator [Spirosoma pollinicola]|uniref:TetR/AcrR family transcriptional regulator n=1 Tax=Spirosoma pollinicola TaxID=2057025 RepID=UPI001F0B8D8E|nr:TetR/AcrR family transcriptional regulator [Spirosoma pollinicola]